MQWSLSTRDKYDGIMYVQYTVEPLYKGQVGWYYVCTVYSGASLQGTSMTVLCMYSIQWSLSTRDKYVHTVYNGASLQGTSMTVLCMYSIQWSLSTRDKYDGIMHVQYTVEPLYKGQV